MGAHLTLLSSRPCCSKSDDFYTFGPIFLEKGFEREVRPVQGWKSQGSYTGRGLPAAGCGMDSAAPAWALARWPHSLTRSSHRDLLTLFLEVFCSSNGQNLSR